MGFAWMEMAVFAEKYLPSKAYRKAAARVSVESLYDAIYAKAKPKIEKAIAEKEAELEAMLDGFAALSPTLKERANKRGEALQKEIDRLQRDLRDVRVPWERLQADLAARQEALERATATLNQEGHFRQKAEVLKTVIGRIVCNFGNVGNVGNVGKRCSLKSIEYYAPEVAAVRPLGFLGTPHWDWCQAAKAQQLRNRFYAKVHKLVDNSLTPVFAALRLCGFAPLRKILNPMTMLQSRNRP